MRRSVIPPKQSRKAAPFRIICESNNTAKLFMVYRYVYPKKKQKKRITTRYVGRDNMC